MRSSTALWTTNAQAHRPTTSARAHWWPAARSHPEQCTRTCAPGGQYACWGQQPWATDHGTAVHRHTSGQHSTLARHVSGQHSKPHRPSQGHSTPQQCTWLRATGPAAEPPLLRSLMMVPSPVTRICAHKTAMAAQMGGRAQQKADILEGGKRGAFISVRLRVGLNLPACGNRTVVYTHCHGKFEQTGPHRGAVLVGVCVTGVVVHRWLLFWRAVLLDSRQAPKAQDAGFVVGLQGQGRQTASASWMRGTKGLGQRVS